MPIEISVTGYAALAFLFGGLAGYRKFIVGKRQPHWDVDLLDTGYSRESEEEPLDPKTMKDEVRNAMRELLAAHCDAEQRRFKDAIRDVIRRELAEYGLGMAEWKGEINQWRSNANGQDHQLAERIDKLTEKVEGLSNKIAELKSNHGNVGPG